MFTKIQKKTMICVVMLLLLVMALVALTDDTHLNVQAETFEQRIPNYGLYCNESEIITNGKVKFNLTDTELLSQGKGIVQYEYQAVATNREVEFAIPFIARACELPNIGVTVNGQNVEGTVWYGERAFGVVDFDVENIYSPVLDESVMGTLYTVIPDNDTITISLSLNERTCYVYETFTNYSSSHSADGNNTWTIRNALATSDYEFFVVGDISDYSFSSSSEYQTKTLTCKEFIDGKYAEMIEYYDVCSVPVEFFYSLFNKALQGNSGIEYRELFENSFGTSRLNAYKFSVSIDVEAVISYELPISVQRNFAFEPLIYLVEQKRVGNNPTNYSIELSNNIPYIIKSSIETVRNGLSYTAETAEDFYFVFSSSEKPTNTLANNEGANTTVLIICIVVGMVVMVLVVLIGITLYRSKFKIWKNK